MGLMRVVCQLAEQASGLCLLATAATSLNATTPPRSLDEPFVLHAQPPSPMAATSGSDSVSGARTPVPAHHPPPLHPSGTPAVFGAAHVVPGGGIAHHRRGSVGSVAVNGPAPPGLVCILSESPPCPTDPLGASPGPRPGRRLRRRLWPSVSRLRRRPHGSPGCEYSSSDAVAMY